MGPGKCKGGHGNTKFDETDCLVIERRDVAAQLSACMCVSRSMSTIQVVRRHRVQRAPACNDDTPCDGVGMEWRERVLRVVGA